MLNKKVFFYTFAIIILFSLLIITISIENKSGKLTGFVVSDLAEETFDSKTLNLQIKEPEKTLLGRRITYNKNKIMEFKTKQGNILLYFDLLNYSEFVKEIVEDIVNDNVPTVNINKDTDIIEEDTYIIETEELDKTEEEIIDNISEEESINKNNIEGISNETVEEITEKTNKETIEDIVEIKLKDIQKKVKDLEDEKLDEIEKEVEIELNEEEFDIIIDEENSKALNKKSNNLNPDYKWGYELILKDLKFMAKIDVTSDEIINIYNENSLKIGRNILSFSDLTSQGYKITFKKPSLEIHIDNVSINNIIENQIIEKIVNITDNKEETISEEENILDIDNVTEEINEIEENSLDIDNVTKEIGGIEEDIKITEDETDNKTEVEVEDTINIDNVIEEIDKSKEVEETQEEPFEKPIKGTEEELIIEKTQEKSTEEVKEPIEQEEILKEEPTDITENILFRFFGAIANVFSGRSITGSVITDFQVNEKGENTITVYIERDFEELNEQITEDNLNLIDLGINDIDNNGIISIGDIINLDPTLTVIPINDAEHLDINKNFISNIYDETKEKDDVWSETINNQEYVRVSFEQPLDNKRDITIYPRIVSGNPRIEVYEVDGTELIAEFTNLNSNKYNKIFLTNLISETQDIFDLKIIGGSLEFDHIIDPTQAFYNDCSDISAWTTGSGNGWGVTSGRCDGTNGHPDSDINTTDFSLSTATTANISASFESSGLDVLDNSYIAINMSNDSGTTWYEVWRYNAVSNNDATSGSVQELLDGNITFTANMRIMIVCDSNGGEHCFLDDLNVTDYTPPDNDYPIFTSPTEDPSEPTTYSSSQTYELNITITSTNSTTGLEFNGTNYTAGNLTASLFNVSNLDLEAGNHSYYWWSYGNGTSKNFNFSKTYYYNISRAIPLGSISGTTPITFGTAGDVQGSESNTGDGNVAYNLYRNDTATAVSNPDTTTLGAGLYNYTWNATAGTNYTSNASIATFTLEVQQAASDVNLTLNDSDQNITITTGGTINLNCSTLTGDSTATLSLYQEGSSINSGTSPIGNTTTFNTMQIENITCIYTNTQNYTTSFETWWVNITDTTPPDINITFPALNNTNTTDTSYDMNYTASDNEALSVCWWTEDGGVTNTTLASCTTNITGETWTEGFNTIRVYANDTNNNINSSEITFRLDTINPDINITFPALNNTNTTDTGYDVNFTTSDSGTGLSVCWWTEDGSVTNNTLASCTTNITGETWTEGFNTIRVYANDSANNINSSEIIFRLDTTVPNINITFPALNNTNTTDTGYDVNYTVSDDISLSVCWWTEDNGVTNNTLASCTTNITGETWDEGFNTIRVYANDTLKNINSSEITFRLDTTGPDINITFPALNNTNTTDTGYDVNYTVSDSGVALSTCWWTEDDGVTNNTLASCTTNITGETWTEGLNTIRVYANDTANNINSSEITFRLDTTAPNFIVANLSVLTNETTIPLLDLNATDNGIGTISGFAINWTDTFNITFADGNITNNTGLAAGNYWINASVNDTLGNTNYSFIILINVTDAGGGDTTPPDVNITYPLNITYSVNVSDLNYSYSDVNPDSCWYSTDGGSTNSSSVSAGTNFTNVVSDEGSNTWLVYCNDTIGNENSSSITFTLDTKFPIFTSPTETPSEPTTYSSSQNYEFNITITSTNSTTGLEFNGTNYTAGNLTASLFNVSNLDLEAGNHSYYWWSYGNGTNKNFNSSETYYYNISRAIPQGTISGTTPITFGTAGDVQGSESNAKDANVAYNLYRNDTSTAVSNPDTTTLGAGLYNYTWNATAGTNYTANASIATFTLEVQQATSDVNLTLDDIDSNITITTGDTINLNCSTLTGDSTATLTLYQEESLINSGTSPIGNTTTFNTIQVENITCIYANTQNYTTSFETWWVNVTDTTNPDINITFPALNNTNTTDTGYDVNYTASDDVSLSVCWWTEDGGTTNITLASCTTNITGETWDEGFNVIRVYANDTSNNINNSETTFRLDTTPPNFEVANLSVLTNETTDPLLDLNATDNGIGTISGFAINWTDTFNISFADGNLSNISAIIQGNYWINVSVNDTLGNTNYSFIILINVTNATPPDLIFPDINITFPAINNTNTTDNNYHVNYTASDDIALSECWWTQDNGVTNTTLASCTTNITGETWDEGFNTIRVYANDTSNNINSSEITFRLDTTPPSFDHALTTQTVAENQKLAYDVNATDTGVGLSGYVINSTYSLFTMEYDTGNITNSSSLSDQEGEYYFNISINDTLNNKNTSILLINVTSVDTTTPQLIINSPTNNTNSSNTGLHVNFTATDNVGLSQCWYSNDTMAVNITLADCSTNITTVTWSEGIHNITLFANDTSGNENQSEITYFTIDTILPNINITFPALNNTNTTDTSYDVNYTFSDTNIDQCWWNVNSGSNTTVSCGTNITGETWSEGFNTIRVYANDTANNVNNSQITFRLDTTPPDFEIANLSVLTNVTTDPLLDLNATDNGIGTISGFAINWTDTFNISFADGNLSNISAIIQGNYYINASVNDTLGNINYSIIFINVTNSTPPDLINPLIDYGVGTKSNNSNLSQNFVYVNVTVTEEEEDRITFNLYYANGTSTNSTSYTDGTRTINWTDLSDNSYEYNVTVNDTSGNTNSTDTRTIKLDTTKPDINITFPLNISYSVNVSDINYSHFDVNPDSCWYSTDGGSTNSSSVSAGTNFTNVVSNEGSNTWLVYCNDTIGNENSASITFIKDTSIPIFTSPTETPTDPATYSSSQTYEFNITITSTNSTAGIEFDGINYTTTNLTESIYNWTTTDLSVGTYNYYHWAYGNGTSNNYNSSETYSYTINAAIPLGSISGTTPITFGTAGDVQGSETNTNDGDVIYTLYRNDTTTAVSNPDTTVLGVSLYNYTWNATAGTNYTSNASIATFTLEVQQAASDVNLTLNNADSNITITTGDTINLNCSTLTGDSTATLTLYQEESLINSGTSPIGNTTTFSTVQIENVTCIYANTQNYTTSFETWWVNVTTDNTNPNINITFPLNTTYSTDVTDLNYTYSDSNPDSCWNSINGGLTNSSSVSAGTNFTNVVSVEGDNTWTLYCNDTIGNENSTSVTFIKDTTTPDPTPDAPGGGGTRTARSSNFILNTDLIKTSIKQEESKRETITIKNTGDTELNVSLSLENIEGFMVLSETSFILKKGETKTINIDVFARENENIDAYTGRIIITANGVVKIINIILEVKGKKPLFDIRTEVLTKIVNKKKKVKANISILNLGDLRNIDLILFMAIKDFDGNIITFKDESLAINEELNLIRELVVPEDILDGQYIFYSKISYGNITATSSDVFNVKTKEKLSPIFLAIILILIIGIIFYSIIRFRKNLKYKKREELEPIERLETQIKPTPKIPTVKEIIKEKPVKKFPIVIKKPIFEKPKKQIKIFTEKIKRLFYRKPEERIKILPIKIKEPLIEKPEERIKIFPTNIKKPVLEKPEERIKNLIEKIKRLFYKKLDKKIKIFPAKIKKPIVEKPEKQVQIFPTKIKEQVYKKSEKQVETLSKDIEKKSKINVLPSNIDKQLYEKQVKELSEADVSSIKIEKPIYEKQVKELSEADVSSIKIEKPLYEKKVKILSEKTLSPVKIKEPLPERLPERQKKQIKKLSKGKLLKKLEEEIKKELEKLEKE